MNKELTKRFLSSFVILPLVLFLLINGSILFLFFLSILFLGTSYEWIKMCKKKNLLKIVGVMFLTLSFYSAFQIRNYAGLNLFLFIFAICISTDLGGYFFGKFFKGPKLTKISPNKTYSGVIGSLLFSVIVGFIFSKYFYFSLYFIDSLNVIKSYELLLIFFILLISIISQLGDLIISYFKRLAKVKDTGKIIPGHGGLLDRIDGLIFAMPISYLFMVL